MFAASFCIVRMESPPSAVITEAFRAQSRPQPSRATPIVRPPWKLDYAHFFRFQGRSDEAGCLAAVEVELEFETPLPLTPQASSHCLNAEG